VGLVVPAFAGTASAADEPFEPGSGRARSNLFEVVPRTGGLGIPFSFGRALTQYQGARAEATATVGHPPPPPAPPSAVPASPFGTVPQTPAVVAPAAEDECGSKNPGGNGGGSKPPATKSPFSFDLKASSDDEGAEKGKTESYLQSPEGSPIAGSMARQDVKAKKDPFGEAVSTMGTMGIPGVAEVTGGRAEARAGVVEGKTRLADGVVTIDRLRLLGDTISFDNLRWEASQRTGAGEGATGAFKLGQVTVAGTPLPAAPEGEDPFGPVNEILAPSGLTILAPKFEEANGVARVSPMSLRLTDSPFGREYVGPTVANLQPVRDPLVAAFLSYSCDAGLAVTVADVALSGASGSGGITFDFGGVSATTEGAVFDNPFDDVIEDGFGSDPFGSLPPGVPDGFPAGGGELPPESVGPFLPPEGYVSGGAPMRYASGAAPLPTLPDTSPFDGTPSGAGEEQAAPPPGDYIQPALGSSTRQLKGKRGGSALAVGLAGLAAVAGLGAADVIYTRRRAAGAA
jgi:hypothetical protein